MKYEKVDTMLAKARFPDRWFALDYNTNLYLGCDLGCIYCDSRCICYGVKNFSKVRGKENYLEILEEELKSTRPKGVVGIGSLSDPYNLQEEKEEITRKVLKLLLKYGFGVAINTKSDLILRDIDILKKINKKADVIVAMSITTPYDDLALKLETKAPSSSARYKAVQTLVENGIYAGIALTPVIPEITDVPEDLALLTRIAAEHNAKFVFPYMGVTLRDRQGAYFFRNAEKHFPGINKVYKEKYGKQRFFYTRSNLEPLYGAFIEECEKHDMVYKMPDIIEAYKTKTRKRKRRR